jgi:hypothetical protein
MPVVEHPQHTLMQAPEETFKLPFRTLQGNPLVHLAPFVQNENISVRNKNSVCSADVGLLWHSGKGLDGSTIRTQAQPVIFEPNPSPGSNPDPIPDFDADPNSDIDPNCDSIPAQNPVPDPIQTVAYRIVAYFLRQAVQHLLTGMPLNMLRHDKARLQMHVMHCHFNASLLC